MKLRLSLLITIVLIGILLRTIALNIRPMGFTWDEAALGYNAYSLLKTGRDEYGQLAPVIFKSFGDYKPGLYIYFTVLPVNLLGLNEISTRLPSALFGTVLILAVYLLVRRLFPDKPLAALFSAAVIAVNPWALQFSRGAWEANLSLLLTVLGVVLFLKGLHLRSSIFFGLTFWSYQGAKLFTPLIILALLFIFGKNLAETIKVSKKSLFTLIISILIIGVFVLPLALNFSSQSGRLKVFSVFSYQRGADYVGEILKEDSSASKNWLYYLFHSEPLDQMRGVFQRYLNHLSPRFIFVQGDWTSLRHSLYNYGYFHLPELVALLLGFLVLFSKGRSGSRFIFIWLLLAPIPAAFSRDLVSGVRTLPLVIPLSVVMGLGLDVLFRKKVLFGFYSLLVGLFMVYYLDLYYVHGPFYAAVQWVSPYKPAIEAIKPYLNNYQHVVMTDKLGQPYIFFLFYLKIDPASYQKEAKFIADSGGDVGLVPGFDKFSFRPVFWPSLRGQNNTIFIGDQYELPEKDLNIPNLIHVGDIYYPDGQFALRIVALK